MIELNAAFDTLIPAVPIDTTLPSGVTQSFAWTDKGVITATFTSGGKTTTGKPITVTIRT